VGIKVDQESDYAVYKEGHTRGFFLRTGPRSTDPEFHAYVWPGLCAFPDFLRADARDWWGRQYRSYTEMGVAGFVDDMNEPAMHSAPIEADDSPNCEPPPDLPHGDHEPATHAEVRNVYANEENRAVYEFLRRERPSERPFLLTRAGFAGLQRHAAVWTGDVSSCFEHLEMSLPQLINLGLSGVPFAGTDIGGFFENCDEELLIRWTQLGSVYPFARNHSARGTSKQEPWVHGPAAESACRRALEWRYRLVPYVYTLFAAAARTGAPPLRPLFWEFAFDRTTHAIADQALLGSGLLIAPILRPGKEKREVYLPEGGWTDLRSRERYEGPSWILVDAPLDGDMPVFARAGSIIPFGPALQWVDERPLDPLVLEVFPDERGHADGMLYEDDGVSLVDLDGAYAWTTFSYSDGSIVARREGSFEPSKRAVEVVLATADANLTATLPDDGAWEVRIG
jgi:alpha-glucosidase